MRKLVNGPRAASLTLALCLISAAGTAQQTGHTPNTSPKPEWPAQVKAPQGAPNILLIMTDDVGFGATSTFGGPVPTPTFDSLAEAGIRYNQFNTTALCSPTRAALLTGRNPHAVGMGNVTNLSTAYPGYTSIIPRSAATVAEVLKDGGYSTAMFGKGHITPDWEQSQVGPFDRWPTGLGFEYFYGFLNADASQFAPALVRNTTPVDPATGKPDYVLDKDMADDAIGWIDQQKTLAPDKPFFVYYAPGTAHTPHHAPREWLEKFRGKFDSGWDKMREETYVRQKRMGIIPANAQLTPRPSSLPAWNSLSPDQKWLYARHMEAYAAALAFADAQIGRIVQHLKDSGQFDNTLIIYIQGDNGGSAEGTLDGLMYEQSALARATEAMDYKLAHIDDIGTGKLYAHYPAPWAWATNAPFQYYKQVASHFGGTRNGLVMSWPGHIPAGGSMRSQFHFVTDIMPTMLEAAGIAEPKAVNGVEQQRMDGVSMNYSFSAPGAPSRRTTQVFEMMQNMGIYKDGWFAGTTPARPPWLTGANVATPVDQREWQLYNVAKDYSEARNLAASNPAKLQEMKDLFWKEAAANNITPIHNSTIGEGSAGRPSLTEGQTKFVYRSRLRRVAQDTAPHIINRSFAIDADIVVPEGGADGAIIAQGGQFSGYSLSIIAGRVVFTYNAVPPRIYMLAAPKPVVPGQHHIAFDFQYDGGGPIKGGTGRLSIDGQKVAEGRIDHTLRWISHTEGLDIGADTTTPVNPEQQSPAEFTGQINAVKVTLKE
ncbi:arylsulfatase [Sphingobium lactosutens]|uniref:arylsulfatase n=1 Tax=Sphingobium lactosutens TaxID=522773 RepID=UPI003563770F